MACVMQHDGVCVCLCAHTNLGWSPTPLPSPPACPGSSMWMGEAGHQCLQLAGSGAIPKPLFSFPTTL